MNLVPQLDAGLWETALSVRLNLREDLVGVLQELVDGVGVGRMEGQGNHGLYLVQLNVNHPVVPGHIAGFQGLVVLGPLMGFIEAFRDLVGLPDGGQAGGLSGHHVDAVAEVDGQAADARAHKLQHPVVHKAGGKGSLDEGQGHVLGADAVAGLAGEVHQHHLG